MVALDNLVVTTALPVIRRDLGASLVRARVDGQRLHPDLRRPAADRRRARRPIRSSPDVRHRPRDLHGRLRGRRPLAVERHPDPGPRGPGRRWRDRHAAQPDHPVRRRSAGASRRRPRGLGRHRRPGHRHRPGRRRRHRRRRLVALDLLAQRADRHRRRHPGRPSPRRVAWSRRAASTSSASAS